VFRSSATARDDRRVWAERPVVFATAQRDRCHAPGRLRPRASASARSRAGINHSIKHASDDEPVDTGHDDVAVCAWPAR
jgi:hypothetical protein